MLSIYYKIWVDAISLSWAKTGKAGNWKLLTIIPMSVIQGINLLAIFLLVRILSHNRTLALFPVHIFSTGPLNVFCSVLITYFIPFVLLNYLLIFSMDQYAELVRKYNDQRGKLYLRYVFISIGIIVVPIALKFIF